MDHRSVGFFGAVSMGQSNAQLKVTIVTGLPIGLTITGSENMETSKVLSVVGLCLAALVALAEVGYYFSHQFRPGVSPHLIALSGAVVLLAVAQLLRDHKP